MHEIKTKITINASAQTVWHHLTNLSAYPSWNPFIVSSEGEIVLGETIKNVMINGGKPTTFRPVLTVVDEGKSLEWVGKLPLGAFTGNHYFYLKPLSEANTLLIHGERFTGWLSGLIMSRIKKNTLASFKAMNDALKNRCETL